MFIFLILQMTLTLKCEVGRLKQFYSILQIIELSVFIAQIKRGLLLWTVYDIIYYISHNTPKTYKNIRFEHLKNSSEAIYIVTKWIVVPGHTVSHWFVGKTSSSIIQFNNCTSCSTQFTRMVSGVCMSISGDNVTKTYAMHLNQWHVNKILCIPDCLYL